MYFLVFLVCFGNQTLFAQEMRLNFFSLSRFDGLSNNDVTCFVKDTRGYLWIGTNNGLNRYNGHDFRVYQSVSGDEFSIPGNHITAIKTDRDGEIWLATQTGGIARYNQRSDDFTVYSLIKSPGQTGSNHVNDLGVDTGNIVWAVTAGGLFYYDRGADDFVQLPVMDIPKDVLTFPLDTSALFTLSSELPVVATDENGGVWVVYPDLRLSHLNLETGLSRHFGPIEGAGASSGYTFINSMLSFQGLLYIGSRSHGLIVFDPESMMGQVLIDTEVLSTATDMYIFNQTMWISSFDGVFAYDLQDGSYHRYNIRPGDPKSISSQASHAVYVDDMGTLWLGPVNTGINYANIKLPFHHLYEDLFDPTMLSHTRPTALLNDSRGNLWVGFQSGMIEYFRPSEKIRIPVPVQPLNDEEGAAVIFRIFEDSRGDIYLGSWLGGLHKYNRALNKFSPVQKHEDLFTGISHVTDLRDIDEDTDGNLWLALHGAGVARFDKQTGKIKLFPANPANPDMLSNEFVYNLRFDDAQHLWVATPWGLNRMAPGDTTFTRYLATGEPGSLFDSHIRLIFQDALGRMWFAGESFICLYDPGRDMFHTIDLEAFGLPMLIVRSIMEDLHGNFWISSTAGIIRLNLRYEDPYVPIVLDYHVYDVNHGVLSEDFFGGAAVSDNHGLLYFGGILGIDYFDPDLFFQSNISAPMQIEEIRLYNKLIYPGTEKGPALDRHGRAIFSHKQNMLSFTYVSLRYFDFQRSDYYYKLSPLHDEWQFAGKNRFLTFANLAPGNYIFEVKSCVNVEDCEELSSSFHFVIKAPFWMTIWFYTLVIIIFALMLVFIMWRWSYNERKKRIRLERLVGSRTMELAKKNQQLLKLNIVKDRLFSVIGHDLRGPISSMMGLLELLTTKYDALDDERKKRILANLGAASGNYYLMVDNLLHWSRSQADSIHVKSEKVLLSGLIDIACEGIKNGLDHKGVSFMNNVSLEISVLADPEMLKIIIRNLLSNALKFTPNDGNVRASASYTDANMVRVDIRDTGVGIQPDIAATLFQTKESVSGTGTAGESGTGLGLVLCKEFALKLGGDIWIAETSPKGTTFSFTIPAAIRP